MHRILREQTLSLSAAARTIAEMTGSRAPHVSTIYRWCTRGVRGADGTPVQLGYVRIGRRHITSREAIERWAAALASCSDGSMSIKSEADDEAARKELEAAGFYR